MASIQYSHPNFSHRIEPEPHVRVNKDRLYLAVYNSPSGHYRYGLLVGPKHEWPRPHPTPGFAIRLVKTDKWELQMPLVGDLGRIENMHVRIKIGKIRSMNRLREIIQSTSIENLDDDDIRGGNEWVERVVERVEADFLVSDPATFPSWGEILETVTRASNIVNHMGRPAYDMLTANWWTPRYIRYRRGCDPNLTSLNW